MYTHGTGSCCARSKIMSKCKSWKKMVTSMLEQDAPKGLHIEVQHQNADKLL